MTGIGWVSSKPIEEPVSWYGPMVMNTQEELRQAVTELQSATFIKLRSASLVRVAGLKQQLQHLTFAD